MGKKKGELSAIAPKTVASEYIGNIKRLVKTSIIAESPEFMPEYEHENDACCDVKANIPEGEIAIGQGEVKRIPIGIKLQMPNGFEAQIRCRSGWASKGLMVVNGIGTIDSNFTDTICVIVTNISNGVLTIKHLAKIAQMTIKPVWYFDFIETDTINITDAKVVLAQQDFKK